MSNPTVQQKIETIAAYMGGRWKSIKLNKRATWRYYMSDNTLDWVKHPDHLAYNKDWNRLMGVVERISKTPLLEADGTPCTDPQDVCHPTTWGMPTEDGKRYMVRFKGSVIAYGDTLIEAVFEACYDFIEWDNKLKNNG